MFPFKAGDEVLALLSNRCIDEFPFIVPSQLTMHSKTAQGICRTQIMMAKSIRENL